MTTSNDDQITVQRVTSTVAGEYREWTVTVRQSSPAGVGDPLNAMTPGARQLLPDAVRAALGDWLEGRPLVADGAPLLVGRDFSVGDRVRGEERAPLFPIAEPEPAAPYAGRTALRRTYPEAPVRLWNAEHTDHLDVTARADSGRTSVRGARRLRVADKHADVARAWLTGSVDIDENVFVVWLDREWTLAAWSFGDHATLDLLPLPKPPRVDQLLGRPSVHEQLLARLNDGQTLAEATAVDLGPARPKVTPPEGAPYAGPFPDLAKGDRIGVEHPDGTITTHEFSGDPAHPVAGDPAANLGTKLSTMRAALSESLELDDPPEAYTVPDFLGSLPNPLPPSPEMELTNDYAEPVGTVTSGLKCSKCNRAKLLGHDDGQIADHAYNCQQRDVDEVLPMPGGPNDRLSQASTRCGDADPETGVQCMRPAGHNLRSGGATPHRSPGGGLLWGDPVVPATKRSGYGDLYARLPYLHDAVAEEDQ